MHVVKITDGLGNQMFQYAFARKLQLLTKKSVYLDTRFINHEDVKLKGETTHIIRRCDRRKYGLENFQTVLPIADEKILSGWNYLENPAVRDWLTVMAKKNLWIWRYENENEWTDGKENICEKCLFPTYYEGYYFNIDYYNDIKNILYKEFKLSTPIKLSPYLKEVLTNSNTVSVHVRRGDFIKLSRDITKRPYYQNAIEWIKENVSNPQFLIFSDDIQWVKENMPIEGDKIYVSEIGYSDYEELTIMKHCKHNIIANSTFSYWAAYLNPNKNKFVIYPKNWRNSIIPQGWIAF